MVVAVAFLMFIFSVSLDDTDERNNYADNRYNNTNDTYSDSCHQLCTFHYISHLYHLR